MNFRKMNVNNGKHTVSSGTGTTHQKIKNTGGGMLTIKVIGKSRLWTNPLTGRAKGTIYILEIPKRSESNVRQNNNA